MNTFRLLSRLALFFGGTSLALAQVDLIITGVTSPEEEVQPGEVASFAVTVRNIGTDDYAGGLPVIVRLTGSGLENLPLDSSPFFDAIASQGEATITLELPIGSNDQNGLYTDLSFTVDATNVVTEANDNNNTASGLLNVFGLPDIEVDAVVIPEIDYYPGTTFGVSATFNNIGTRASGPFVAELILQVPVTGTSFSVPVKVASIEPLSSASFTEQVQIPLDNPSGEDYAVLVRADSPRQILELDETNNEGLAEFAISTLPDLEMLTLSYESGLWVAGDIIDFSFSFRNKPATNGIPTERVFASADLAYELWIVLSTDLVYGNEDDFLLFADTYVGNPDRIGQPNASWNLLPGDIIQREFSVAMPTNFFGDYFVLAKIDEKESVEEYIENDINNDGDNVYYARETAKIQINPHNRAQPTTYRVSVKADGTEGSGLSETPDVSDSGRFTVFASYAQLTEEDTDTFSDIYLKDNLNNAVTLVSRTSGVGNDDHAFFPRISADGLTVVFESFSSALVPTDTNLHSDIFVYDVRSGLIEKISVPTGSSTVGSANASSSSADVSDDGRYVVFESFATNLAGNADGAFTQIYLRDRELQTTRLLSAAGATPGNNLSIEPAISGDGRIVTFTSRASNFSGASAFRQIFWVAASGGTPGLASVQGSTPGNGDSFAPTINLDGSVIAFASDATNLAPPAGGDTNNMSDIIIRDRSTSTTERVLAADGALLESVTHEFAPNLGALAPSIDSEGRFVVYRTQAGNILPDQVIRSDGDVYNVAVEGPALGYSDVNSTDAFPRAVSDLYIHDRQNPTQPELISRNKFGFQGAAFNIDVTRTNEEGLEETLPLLPNTPSSRNGVISGNGRFIVFASDGRSFMGYSHLNTNLLSEDNNEVRDIFLRDRRTIGGTTPVEPPTVQLTAPVAGQTVNPGQTIALMAQAVDQAPGRIERVDFFVNGRLLDSVTRPAYFATWTPDQAGFYRIEAVATDDDGWVAQSTPVDITVGDVAAPVVTLTQPADGSTTTVLSPIQITVDASSSVAQIARVEFYIDGEQVGEVDTFPYTFPFIPTNTGNYEIFAIAIDEFDQRQTTPPANISVEASQGPSVVIVEPQGDRTVSVGEVVIVTANAISTTGVEGGMTAEFFSNGALIATVDQPPFSANWAPTSEGVFALIARVTEAATGASATSQEIVVTAQASQPPTVSLRPRLVPPTARSTTILEADAFDPDGNVTSVAFFVNGVPLGEPDTAGPFNTIWQPQAVGDYQITILAVDNSGQQTVSTENIEVVPPRGLVPRVSLGVTASGNVTPGSSIVARANILDEDPETVRLSFFLNGNLVPPDQVRGGSVILDPEPQQGTSVYSITALAQDADGNGRAFTLQPLYVSDVAVDQPLVDLVRPLGGETLTAGSRLNLRARTRGSAANNVSELIFYANGEEIGRAREAPYILDWVPDFTGPAEITVAALQPAEAFDHDANVDTPSISVTPTVVASPAQVMINEPIGDLPAVSLERFPEFDSYPVGAQVVLIAAVQDIGGAVNRVSFFLDGELLGVEETFPFSYKYTLEREGTFFLNAVVEDNDGNIVTSPLKPIVVSSTVIPTTPAISLTLPETGVEGANVALRASAEGFVIGPTQVDFYVNGQLVSSATQRPYNTNWLANLSGEVSVVATAHATLSDGSTLTATSDVAKLTLQPNVAPTITGVSLSFPDQDATSKPNPLRGEALVFTAEVDDTGLIETVELLRDGESVGTSEDASSPFRLTDTPPGLGTFEYTVVVTDAAGAQAVLAQPVVVEVTLGTPPTVSIVTPTQGAVFNANSAITFEAQAEDQDGEIASVQFFVDGVATGAAVTQPPFRITFTPTGAGSFNMSARAVDNSGNAVVSEDITFLIDEEVPEVTSFAVDLAGGSILVGEPLTFTAQATDPVGIDAVELVLNGSFVVQRLRSAPFEFTFIPTEPGSYVFQARVINNEGRSAFSESINIQVRPPSPLVENFDFVYQTLIDLLFNITGEGTTVEAVQDTYALRLDTGALSRDRFLAELMGLASNNVLAYENSYLFTHSALRGFYITHGRWPSRLELNEAVAIIADAALVRPDETDNPVPALVFAYTNILEERFVEASAFDGLPEVQADPAHINAYISFLWDQKYGEGSAQGNQETIANLANRFYRILGRDLFTADFIIDAIPRGQNLDFTAPLALRSPPNQNLEKWADAASLIINFLRIDEPTQEEVEALASFVFAEQVGRVLAPAGDTTFENNPYAGIYQGRFQTPFSLLQHHAGGWKLSSWFGWFAPSEDNAWSYHLELGWIYAPTGGQTPESFWFYDRSMDWTWTNKALYPNIYTSGDDTWYLFGRFPRESDSDPRWFYNYGTGDWVQR